jgi:DNA-binding transcriptional MerR regulator
VTSTTPPDPDDGMSIDEIAAAARLPVRTIREYQTIGLLPGPERRGRVGVYRPAHLGRLRLIGRLQDRGYSLAGIKDLLTSWRDGADLGDVLGLAADELVHLDEPGAPVTADQLGTLVPSLVPDRLADLMATGVVAPLDDDRLCVPSPSLLQLAIDALDAGYSPDDVLDLLATIRAATDDIADAVARLLARPPTGVDPDRLAALTTKGRGTLAHGTGRLTIHTLGQLLGLERRGRAERDGPA